MFFFYDQLKTVGRIIVTVEWNLAMQFVELKISCEIVTVIQPNGLKFHNSFKFCFGLVYIVKYFNTIHAEDFKTEFISTTVEQNHQMIRLNIVIVEQGL